MGLFALRESKIMPNWAVVILAGGRGHRMQSSLPKVLHQVCGKPMICHVRDSVREVLDVIPIVVVPQDSAAVRECLKDKVVFAVQSDPLGTGHAVMQAEGLISEEVSNVLILYGDTPLIRWQSLQRLMDQHILSGSACTLLTTRLVPPYSMGRVLRSDNDQITKIVEERDADEEQKAIDEVNGGMYCFEREWMSSALSNLSMSASGEYYLTDLVEMTNRAGKKVSNVESTEKMEILGVNDRFQLNVAEATVRERVLKHWMLTGVTIIDPVTTYIDADVVIGKDTTIFPNTILSGSTVVGERCRLGPNSMIYDSKTGDDCKVMASMLEGATVGSSVEIGPFSHLRAGTTLEQNVHVGNFVEVKNSRLKQGTKMGHFGYVGDAVLGRDVNVGAGTVTCNFDGIDKHTTVVGDDVFLGCDTMLVAPVEIGNGSITGAGAVVNRDIPPKNKAIGMPARFMPLETK